MVGGLGGPIVRRTDGWGLGGPIERRADGWGFRRSY